MPRYIDADKLINWCNETAKAQHTVIGKLYINEFLQAVVKSEVVDVVPRSESEWYYDEENECFICSNCKTSALNNYRGLSVDSNYCPNCGAKRKEASNG